MLPSINDPTAATSGFFLTDIQDSKSANTKASPAPKKKNSEGGLFNPSPSGRNILDLSGHTFEHKSNIPFDRMLEVEREKATMKNTRS